MIFDKEKRITDFSYELGLTYLNDICVFKYLPKKKSHLNHKQTKLQAMRHLFFFVFWFLKNKNNNGV